MSLINKIELSFSTLNILNPSSAVKWKEKEGLNGTGRAMSRADLKASLADVDPCHWKDYSNWDDRCPKIVDIISQLSSIFCLQEVSEASLSSLQSLMKNHRFTNLALHSNQQFGNVLLYDADKINLLANYEIKYETQGKYRSAAGALFETSGIPFAAMSVHLAGYNPTELDLATKQQAKESGFKELQYYEKILSNLANQVEGIAGIALAGDFNEDANEAKQDLFRVGYLKQKKYLFDGNTAVTEPSKNRRIDFHCWQPIREQKSRLTSLHLEKAEEQVSDHLPTGIVIEAIF